MAGPTLLLGVAVDIDQYIENKRRRIFKEIYI